MKTFFFCYTCLLCSAYWLSCAASNQPSAQTTENKEERLAHADGTYADYVALRDTLLNIHPEQFEKVTPGNRNQVFSAVAEWNLNDTICSVFAFKTGDVSVYLSTGKLYMGGIQVARFRQMAIEMVDKAQPLLAQAQPATDTKLPENGMVNFFLTTHQGRYHYTGKADELLKENPAAAELYVYSRSIADAFKQAIKH